MIIWSVVTNSLLIHKRSIFLSLCRKQSNQHITLLITEVQLAFGTCHHYSLIPHWQRPPMWILPLGLVTTTLLFASRFVCSTGLSEATISARKLIYLKKYIVWSSGFNQTVWWGVGVRNGGGGQAKLGNGRIWELWLLSKWDGVMDWISKC